MVLRKLPGDTVGHVRRLAATHGATPFMVLLAAFKLLLSRYCGQDDIALGTPIANRMRADTEDLVGTMVNTLVLRTDLAGDPSFAELLLRVKETALQAYAHQNLPYERVWWTSFAAMAVPRLRTFEYAVQRAQRAVECRRGWAPHRSNRSSSIAARRSSSWRSRWTPSTSSACTSSTPLPRSPSSQCSGWLRTTCICSTRRWRIHRRRYRRY